MFVSSKIIKSINNRWLFSTNHKQTQVRFYRKETKLLFHCWYVDVKSPLFQFHGGYIKTYHRLEFKRLDVRETGQYFSKNWIDMRKFSAEVKFNTKLQRLPYYKKETERLWRTIKARNAELAEYKQKLKHVWQNRSLIDKINSRFQKNVDSTNDTPLEKLKDISGEIGGQFNGVTDELISDHQIEFLEAMRKVDLQLCRAKIEMIVNTNMKLDAECDLAIKYHKFLKFLHQQYQLDDHLGDQSEGTFEALLEANNAFLEAQKLVKSEPKMRWGDEDSVVEETGSQPFSSQPDDWSPKDLTLSSPAEAGLTEGGWVDTGAGTGLGFLSYLEPTSLYGILCSEFLYLFYSYSGVLYLVGYVIIFLPRLNLIIAIKLWSKNLAFNLSPRMIQFSKSLLRTFLFEYSFLVPRIWAFVSQFIKKTLQTDW